MIINKMMENPLDPENKVKNSYFRVKSKFISCSRDSNPVFRLRDVKGEIIHTHVLYSNNCTEAQDVLRFVSLSVGRYHDCSFLESCIVTFPFICTCFVTGNPDSELGQSYLQETHRSYLADHNVLLTVEKQSAEVEHKLLLHGMDCDLSLPLYKLFHWSLSFVSPRTDRQNYLETPFRCTALCSLRP